MYRGKPRRFIAGHQARGVNNSRFGVQPTEATKAKIAEGNKVAVTEGRHRTARGGWQHTPEARQKMADAHARAGNKPRTPRKGVTRNCQVCDTPYYRPRGVVKTGFCSLRCSGLANCSGERNPFFGRKHSPETKALLAQHTVRQRARSVVLPTRPERLVHDELQRRGVVFETEVALGVFCVDVFVPSLKLVIFVDGCYWHACPEHFPEKRRPKTDNCRIPYLTKCGYRVATLWEHEIHKDVGGFLDRLLTC